MATIQVCDFCKSRLAGTPSTLTLKKASKKAGNKYELCSKCESTLQKILVGEEAGIIGVPSDLPIVNNTPPQPSQAAPRERSGDGPRTLGDLDTDDAPSAADLRTSAQQIEEDGDEEFIRRQQATRSKSKATVSPASRMNPTGDPGKQCYHANRTRAYQRTVDGERVFFQDCKDCGTKKLPYRSMRDRASTNATTVAGADVSVRTHPSDDHFSG